MALHITQMADFKNISLKRLMKEKSHITQKQWLRTCAELALSTWVKEWQWLKLSRPIAACCFKKTKPLACPNPPRDSWTCPWLASAPEGTARFSRNRLGACGSVPCLEGFLHICSSCLHLTEMELLFESSLTETFLYYAITLVKTKRKTKINFIDSRLPVFKMFKEILSIL